MKLSDKVCRVWDYGLFTFLAQTMAQDFKRVELFVPWMEPFPCPAKRWIGRDVPGITRIWDFWEDLDSVDVFCFFDVGDADVQQKLRSEERAVFGTGGRKKNKNAAELEIDRGLFKKTLVKHGLAVPKWEIVTGIDTLREKAMKIKGEGFWVKPNVGERGIFETFFISDYKTLQSKLDLIAHDLGVARDACEFMCEAPIPGVEAGSDYFIAAGVAFDTGLYGWEVKGDGYSARAMHLDEMPNAVRKVNDAMAPVWKEYEINAAISTELRVDKNRIPKFVDLASRMGNPPAACISEIYKNFSPIVYGVAHGEAVEPEFASDYVSELSVEAADAMTEPIPLNMTDKDCEKIKIRTVCKKGDQYWHIPFEKNGPTVVKAVGLGKTLEESQHNCLQAAKKFDCPGEKF